MHLFNFLRNCAGALILSLFFALNLSAQSSQIMTNAATPLQLFTSTEKPIHFNDKEYVNNATYLRLQTESLQRALAVRPQHLLLSLPTADGEVLKLDLTTTPVLSDDFQVFTESGKAVAYEHGLYYTGSVNGNTKSVAAVSLFRNMIMGVVMHEGEHYVLGHLQQNKFPLGKDYILYKENDLQIANNFTCGTDNLAAPISDNKPTEGDEKSAKVVKVYFEGDYRLYQDKGNSESNVTDYITGLFNVVRVLYQNENIDTEISEIVVWTNSDPYPSSSSDGALNAFRNRLNGNYNGDLAHLVSTVDANNGGIAYVNALCAPSYGVAYSNIGRNYSQFPTYSWTVSVVTHEMGHNLGSPHTQSCSWPGGALDNCYPVEGNCARGPAPTNGGTIMSYCHLSQYGINFQNGFGELPGNLVRDRVAAASCLGESDGGGDNGGGSGTPNLTANTGNLTIDGATINITQSFANTGDGASTGGKVAYYLSADASFSATDDYLVGTVNIPNIAAGSNSSNVSFSENTASLNLPSGDYFVVYYIDYQDAVAESNENDNLFYWSSPVLTVTNNGGGTDPDYCESAGTDASYEWISNVQISNLNSSSGSDGGYRDFTARTATLSRGSDNNISLTASYSGDPYSEVWRIWIDFNQDKDFDDAGELVFSSSSARVGETTGILSIPTNAPLVTTRMRVSMKWYEEDNQIQSACDNFGYGEVEDYTVTINNDTPAPTCAVTSITAGSQTDCDPSTNTYSQQINVAYDCAGAATIGISVNGEYLGEVNASNSPVAVNITGLDANEQAVDIRAEVCKTDATECPALEEIDLFTAPAPCNAPQAEPCVTYPSERSADNITTSAVTLNWSEAQDARYYQVRVRVRYTYSWSSWYYLNYSYTNQQYISGLSASNRYQFRIRTRCQGGWTRWSPSQDFYTPANLEGEEEVQNTTNVQTLAYRTTDDITPTPVFWTEQSTDTPTAQLDTEPQLTVFPNPAQQSIQVELSQVPTAPVEIYNLNGTLQLRQSMQDTEARIDLANLPKGIYYLRTEVDGEIVTQRVVKI